MAGRYRIIKADKAFTLAGKTLPGFPIVVGPKGVEKEVHTYLESRASASNCVGSRLDEAVILKGWLDLLDSANLSLCDASNAILKKFAMLSLEKGVSEARTKRKISVVFAFYVHASKYFDGFREILEQPTAGKVGTHYPISVEIAWRMVRGKRLLRQQSVVGVGAILKSRERPTPDEAGVEKVTDVLLTSTKSDALSMARWLMARWMSASTLRCAGVAALTVDHLAGALFNEGLRCANGKQLDLPLVGRNQVERQRVLAKVQELRKRNRTAVFPLVTEKGGKQRKVALLLDDLEHNLEFIWDFRDELLRNRTGRALFPSRKTGGHLLPNSIGNLVKLAFKSAKVEGSAHRLRAHSAENVVRMSFYRAVALHGSAFDRDSILMEAAEALGHANLSSLDHYLNNMIGQLNAELGHPVLIDKPDTAAHIRTLVGEMRDNPELEAALMSFFVEHSIRPSKAPGLRGLQEHMADVQRRKFMSSSALMPQGKDALT